MQIPDDIPGSASLRQGTATASINYNLQAKLVIQGDSKPYVALARAPIIVKEKPPETMDTGLNFEHSAAVTCCCCFGRGEAKLEASFEKNVFIIGEQARAFYRLDTTNFKDNIDAVTLFVIRQLSVRNNHGRQRVFEQALISKKEAGIASGMKDEQGKLIEL